MTLARPEPLLDREVLGDARRTHRHGNIAATLPKLELIDKGRVALPPTPAAEKHEEVIVDVRHVADLPGIRAVDRGMALVGARMSRLHQGFARSRPRQVGEAVA